MNVNPRIAPPARNSKAMITGAFVRNAWYVAMWGEDLPREQVVGRTILNEAIALYEATLAKCERILGAQHPTTQVVRDNLCRARNDRSS